MPFKRTSMRYAHTNGHTSCTYTEDGEYIITCGSDGDMRNWIGIDDDDPSSKCLGEFVLCIVHIDQQILVSTDLNTVQAYTFPKGDPDGTKFRFTAPVNCIKVNKNYIAAGSEDTEIKIIKRASDKNENEISLEGHKGPILAIDISIKDNILASCSGDGTLKIWDFDKKIVIKTFDGLPKCISLDDVKSFGTPSFHPVTGQSLAYTLKKEIIILNTTTWEIQFTLTDEKITNDYSYCQFSPDGQYIAAGTQLGEISIWNVSKKETIKGETISSESKFRITSIIWNPKCNGELAYCDSTGQLGTIIGCFDEDIDEIDNDDDNINQIGGGDNIESDFNDFEFQSNGNESDGDDANCVSLEKLKNDTMRNNNLLPDYNDKNSDVRSIKSFTEDRQFIKTFTQQSTFQPGATPNDLKSRYLVWNDIGIVRTHSDSNEGSSIDIEFHDVSTHHAIHMNNYLNYDLGSLSSTVLALSASNTNKLVCIAFGIAGSQEWSIELPNFEGIIAIAATDKLIAVCTDNRMLRIFSVMGTQREVISIPGPVVAICGRNNKLMITYHSAPASEDQHISALLLQTFGLTVHSKETRIPITPGKKLTWIGYSNKGSPVCCDTMGLVQMYSMKTNCWYPICDTMQHSQSVSNNFFLIDILESTQIIQCVLCRGSSYPLTNPKPMVTELPMQIPVCEIESEKSILEESIIRWSNFNVDNSEKLIKESAIKLFAIACRAEMETRAKELIEMIASPALLPLAVKYASKLGRVHLADKLNELAPQIEILEKQQEKDLQEAESNVLNILHNNSIGSSLLMMHNSQINKSSPQIAPKPIVINKKNPFKRSIGNSNITNKNNSLSHLTENATGFDYSGGNSQLTTNNDTVLESQDILIENNENKCENELLSTTTPGSFPDWFQKNKDRLAKNNPDSINLTKIGMKEYKSLNNKDNSDVSGKRKLDEEPAEAKKSGIAKLAKFGFNKR